MRIVISRDGTPIAFDQSGQGPTLILVTGALTTRADWVLPGSGPCTALQRVGLRPAWPRREWGHSAYAVEREVEDIEALITEAGGSAFVYGHSSGAALALEAPYSSVRKSRSLPCMRPRTMMTAEAKLAWRAYIQQLTELLAADRRGDAVALFMQYVGMPADQIEAMRHAPTWPMLEAIAPTLAYDHTAILGEDNVGTHRTSSAGPRADPCHERWRELSLYV